MSLAIFINEQARVLRAPLVSTNASWAANASNLFGAVTKGRPTMQNKDVKGNICFTSLRNKNIKFLGPSLHTKNVQTKKIEFFLFRPNSKNRGQLGGKIFGLNKV